MARWGVATAFAAFIPFLVADLTASLLVTAQQVAGRVQVVGTDAIIEPAALSVSLAGHGAFSIRSETARQNLNDLAVIDLSRVTAHIDYDKARWVVTAPHGRIDRRDETFLVDGGVRIDDLKGDAFTIDSVVLDITSGSLRAADLGNAVDPKALAATFALLK